MKTHTALSLCMLAFATTATAATAAGTWRMHPTFDGRVTHVFDTPDHVYFTSRVLPDNNWIFNDPYFSLFRYDKKGDELISVGSDNLLSDNIFLNAAYCREKRYLMTIDSDYFIDLIHDDGRTERVPGYAVASLPASKGVNGITFTPGSDRAYLATDFGYVSINDRKCEIGESRDYGEKLLSVAKVGSHIVAIHGGRVVSAPESSPRYNLTDYTGTIDCENPITLYPLSEKTCLLFSGGGAPYRIRVISEDENGELKVGEENVDVLYFSAEYNKDGLMVTDPGTIYQFYPDGSHKTFWRPELDYVHSSGSYDLTEMWEARERKGLRGFGKEGDGWTLTHDYIIPDSPAPFISTCIQPTADGGILMSNFGHLQHFANYHGQSPLLLSRYKEGRWDNPCAPYMAPEQPVVIQDPYGFSIDPDNPDYIYASSQFSGFARLSLTDPADVIHFANPSNPLKDGPGFVALAPDQRSTNNYSCSFSIPRFDTRGNLWTMLANFDYGSDRKLHIYCWEAADRKASTSASDVRLPKSFLVEGFDVSHFQDLIPLTTGANRDLLLFAAENWVPVIAIIDTGGTPTDPADDKVTKLETFTDQDGSTFDVHYISAVYEDPATGRVWVGHSEGVFHFSPADLIAGNRRVVRVKVARNDGTNLADYLLNGVPVYDIKRDGNGNKWFATGGAGAVCTTPDGKTILDEVTASTTPLPDNMVYGLGYVADRGSMLFSTIKGIAEYIPSATGGPADGDEELKVYPNPVRPGFGGYVTIDGLSDGALVKIVDGGGNIVKELGPSAGSSVEWDVTNHQFKRVASGVYFILASGGTDADSRVRKGKVLVVN